MHRKKRRTAKSARAMPVHACAICGEPRGVSDACGYICTASLVLTAAYVDPARKLLKQLGKKRAYQLMPIHRRLRRPDELLSFLMSLQDETLPLDARQTLAELTESLRSLMGDPEHVLLVWLKEMQRQRFREAVAILGDSAATPIIRRFEATERLRDLSEHLQCIIGIDRLSRESRSAVRTLHRETRRLILQLLQGRHDKALTSLGAPGMTLAPPSHSNLTRRALRQRARANPRGHAA